MLRDLDIKLVVLAVIGALAFGVYAIFPYVGLSNTPDEEVFYVSPDIGDVEPAVLTNSATPEENGLNTENANAAGEAAIAE